MYKIKEKNNNNIISDYKSRSMKYMILMSSVLISLQFVPKNFVSINETIVICGITMGTFVIIDHMLPSIYIQK